MKKVMKMMNQKLKKILFHFKERKKENKKNKEMKEKKKMSKKS